MSQKVIMESLKNLIATSLSQFFKVLTGLLVIKLIALYQGPSGLGLLGNFISLVSLYTLMAGGGIISGVIKYSSDFRLDKGKLQELRNNAIGYSLTGSFLVVLVSILTAFWWLHEILRESLSIWTIVILLLSQVIVGIANVVVGFLVGTGQTSRFAAISVVGYVVSAPIIFVLIKAYGINGSAIGVLVSVIGVSIIQVLAGIKYGFFRHLRVSLKRENVKMLAKYSIMLLVSAFLFPASEIVIRTKIIDSIGVDAAGIWQGVYRMGAVFLSFGSLFLSYHFMPKLSRATESTQVTKLVNENLCIVLCCMSLVLAGVTVFKKDLISLVLSKEFSEASEYIVLQLVGDLFRVGCFVFGFITVARAATWLYVGSEILQVFFWLGFTHLSFKMGLGLKGVFISYLTTYIVFFLLCSLGYRFYLIYLKKQILPGLKSERIPASEITDNKV